MTIHLKITASMDGTMLFSIEKDVELAIEASVV